MGSSNSGLVSGDDGSVGVGDQVGVKVEGAGVAVADSRDSSNGGGNGRSSDGRGSDGNGSNGGVLGTPGSKVVGTGSGNGGLINGDNGTGWGGQSSRSQQRRRERQRQQREQQRWQGQQRSQHRHIQELHGHHRQQSGRHGQLQLLARPRGRRHRWGGQPDRTGRRRGRHKRREPGTSLLFSVVC